MDESTTFDWKTITPCVQVWRRVLDNGSMEFANVVALGSGFELTGTIVAVHEHEPLEVKYRLECGLDWSTRAVFIEQRRGLQRSALSLAVDNAGAWSDSHTGKLDSLAGCLEVDLELTPITNTLPINRLKLAIGQRAEIAVAWIRFPSLEIVRARQSYERLSAQTYRYCSLASGFTAEIEVDEIGLAIRYEGIWERIAFGNK
jgi:hypothetical protein